MTFNAERSQMPDSNFGTASNGVIEIPVIGLIIGIGIGIFGGVGTGILCVTRGVGNRVFGKTVVKGVFQNLLLTGRRTNIRQFTDNNTRRLPDGDS